MADKFDAGLKRLIADVHREEMDKFRKEVEERFREMKGADPSEVRRISKELEIQGRDLKGMGKSIESLLAELKELRGSFEKLRNVKGDLKDDIESLRSDVEKSIDLSHKAQEKAEAQGSMFDDQVRKLREIKGGLESANAGDLMRQIASMNAKLEWIEDELEDLGIDFVMERIEEIENKIRSLNVSSPIVLE